MHSIHWYRVAALRPALRSHLRVGRHVYRGETWYIIQDPASGRMFRFSVAAERVIALMDGVRTVAEIWELAGRGDEDMPTQDEIVRLLAQLHQADALSIDMAPDVRELLQRLRGRQSRDWLARFANPLAIRTRLFDPDAFLTKTMPFVRHLLGAWGLGTWFLVVAWGLVLCGLHWQELGRSWADLTLAPGSVAIALLIYPAIKAVHELAHAYAVKARGAEVHEIGLMWLVFLPVPYVDASASAAFPDKRARMFVGAAGILAEAFIAAVAMIVWAGIEPGLLRATAYKVMLIAGVSTLLVNGNPLLRYDGYHVLSDFLEIPNLAQRANAHIGYLFRRWVLGLEDARSVSDASGERRWLSLYAPAAFACRLVVLAAIVLLIASWSKTLAVVVGLWSVAAQLLYPALRAMRRLVDEPTVQAARRSVMLRAAAVGLLVIGLGVAPVPLTSRAEGIVWLPEYGEVRAGTDGTLQQWLSKPGTTVRAGQPLAALDDPNVDVRLAGAEAEFRAADARYLAARATDTVDAGTMLAQLQRAKTNLEVAQKRGAALTLISPTDGLFLVARPEDVPGRYFHQGDVIGYVVAATHGTVIAVVDQDDIGLLKTRIRNVQVRLSEDPSGVHIARIARLTPAGGFELPSAALGTLAGGTIAVAPDDPSGIRSLAPIFRVELALDSPLQRLGGRAYVRFSYGNEALALRVYRAARQLFLRRLNA